VDSNWESLGVSVLSVMGGYAFGAGLGWIYKWLTSARKDDTETASPMSAPSAHNVTDSSTPTEKTF